jgi:transcriptional regulator GlxA family with amidase domain
VPTPGYEVTLATLGGREVRCDSGLRVKAQARLESRFETVDTLVVSGGLGHQDAAADARLVGHVRRLAAQARRVASVCTGATVLAAAGLLDGRRATTHWLYARHLAAGFPQVHVDPTPVFVRDGHVATSGGVTAALDLTLAFIEEDHGHEMARRVALGMVTYLQRPGNQAQMSMFTSAPRPDDLLVRRTVDHITSNPGRTCGRPRWRPGPASASGSSTGSSTTSSASHRGAPSAGSGWRSPPGSWP